MSLLAPIALGLFALSIPLVVLYMLRSRRSGVEVSSIRLWIGEEDFVSSAVPWKRLEITAALLLQLFALALFALVLARPFFRETTPLGPHTVLVVDTSGSMALAGRMDSARAEMRDLVAEASDEKLLSIVEAGPSPRVLAAFSRDPGGLEEIVDGVTAGGGTADVEGALRLARGLATPDRPTTLLIVSDGGEEGAIEEPVADARHIGLDAVDDNIAITGFGTSDVGEGSTRVFVEVTSYAGRTLPVAVGLTVDGLDVGSLEVELPAGETRREIAPVDAGPGQVVEATLVGGIGGEGGVGHADGNPLDDMAAIVLTGASELVVGTTGEGSPFIDALLDATPGVIAPVGRPPDVVVMDGGDASAIDRPTWIIRSEEAPTGVTIVGRLDHPVVTFSQSGEPLLEGLDLSDLVIAEADVVQAPGWLPLVSAGDVPLILLGEVDGHRAAYFTFDLVRSNLPVQVAFPVLGSRLLDWLAGSRIGAEAAADAGEPIPLAPPAGLTTVVTTPDGTAVALDRDVVEFARTEQPGVYRVAYVDDGVAAGGFMTSRRFAAAESAGSSRTIAVAEPEGAGVDEGTLVREWAPSILGVLLALVLLEWWVAFGRPRPRRGPVLS